MLYICCIPLSEGASGGIQRWSGMRCPAAWLATMLREVSVTVRANYVGLPLMAGRGAEQGGESRRGRVQTLSAPGSTAPRPKNAARGAPRGDAPRSRSRKPSAMCAPVADELAAVFASITAAGSETAPFGAPPPRIYLQGAKKETGAPSPEQNTGGWRLAV
jgi:hypothetical protein